MNRVNTILIAALAVQIGLAFLVRLGGDAESIAKLESIVDIDKDSVTKVHVYGQLGGQVGGQLDSSANSEQNEFVLVKDGGTWVLQSHFGYPARPEQVDSLLNKISGAKSRQPIATTEPRRKQLRVADDRYERKVVLTHGGGETTLYLGAPAGGRKTAVRVAGKDAVFAIPDLSPNVAAVFVTGWIDGEYFKLGAEIASVAIDNAQGSFVIEKAPEDSPDTPTAGYNVVVNGSDLSPPDGKELDTAALDSMLSRLGSIRMTEPADPNAAPTAGQITFTIKPQGDGQEYHFDAAPDGEANHHLRERGNPHAARVSQGVLKQLFEMSAETLVRDQTDEAATPTPPVQGSPIPMPDGPPGPMQMRPQ